MTQGSFLPSFPYPFLFWLPYWSQDRNSYDWNSLKSSEKVMASTIHYGVIPFSPTRLLFSVSEDKKGA